MSRSRLSFELMPGEFAVVRLPPDAPLPRWAMNGSFFSITRSPSELSVICETASAPSDAMLEAGWRCLHLKGTFGFGEVGIAANFSGSLARAGVGILIVSTFDTDYVLVRKGQLEPALDALRTDGHEVTL